MKCCLSDLRYKEVIDQSTGQRLGYVCDAEIDLDDGKIVSLIVPGQKKLGGLLSGDDDYILPWGSISVSYTHLLARSRSLTAIIHGRPSPSHRSLTVLAMPSQTPTPLVSGPMTSCEYGSSSLS